MTASSSTITTWRCHLTHALQAAQQQAHRRLQTPGLSRQPNASAAGSLQQQQRQQQRRRQSARGNGRPAPALRRLLQPQPRLMLPAMMQQRQQRSRWS
jgi:hypothetical protein